MKTTDRLTYLFGSACRTHTPGSYHLGPFTQNSGSGGGGLDAHALHCAVNFSRTLAIIPRLDSGADIRCGREQAYLLSRIRWTSGSFTIKVDRLLKIVVWLRLRPSSPAGKLKSAPTLISINIADMGDHLESASYHVLRVGP